MVAIRILPHIFSIQVTFSIQILQTGQEIMELDHSGFQTSSATVHASNLGDNKYILQVTPHTVSLMEGGRSLRLP